MRLSFFFFGGEKMGGGARMQVQPEFLNHQSHFSPFPTQAQSVSLSHTHDTTHTVHGAAKVSHISGATRASPACSALQESPTVTTPRLVATGHEGVDE